MIVTAAVLVPSAVGVNCTLIVQLEPAARAVPHVVVREKSLLFTPVIVMLAIDRPAFPVLVRVADWMELVVPTCWLAKEREVGERLTIADLSLLCQPAGRYHELHPVGHPDQYRKRRSVDREHHRHRSA